MMTLITLWRLDELNECRTLRVRQTPTLTWEVRMTEWFIGILCIALFLYGTFRFFRRLMRRPQAFCRDPHRTLQRMKTR